MKKKTVRIIGYVLVTIIALVFLYTILNYQEIRLNLEQEIMLYGPVGLLLAGAIIDTFGGPFGIEVPVIGGILAGIPLPMVILMATIGTSIASLSVFGIGYHYGEVGALAFISRKVYDKWRKRFLKHRRITMVLGALTPVPYEAVNLVAGVFKVRPTEFYLFTVGARFVRILFAVYVALLLG